MRRCLIAGVAACALVIAAACSTGPSRSSVPAPADWASEAETDPLAGDPSFTAPPTALLPSAEPAPAEESPAEPAPDGEGSTAGPLGVSLIAAAGPLGLRLLEPSGEVVGLLGPAHIVTQPTWSRDGLRLAATLIHPATGVSQVAVVDITTGDIATTPTSSPYFFYSWSHDGSRLVALGPSQTGGTAAFILDEAGGPAADVTLQSQSLYVAWEPGGRRLLLHAGHRLLLVNDVDSPRDHSDYGLVGVDFLAPAWVPGTQDFLYVDSYGQAPPDAGEQELLDRRATTSPQLLRRNADTGEITDLGPAGLYTMLAVHPSGDRAAISAASHERPALAGDRSETASISPTGPETGVPAGAVQIVDLATAERLTVLDRIGHWLEWSPDGRHLLIAASSDDPDSIGMSWHIWDGRQSYELARFAPTATFLRDYFQFADQYDETPRLWSPDSDAITFGANTADGGVAAVARLDSAGAMTSLGPSDVSFWSPPRPDGGLP
ncbi:MAG: hypothetical protein F4X85_06400 [Acidimicrobiaceae bacterium]|nr:hypothetical protein [Acidimicrobiaceae bacterium]